MVSYKEFIFIDIIRIIFNSLPLSFRSVDDKNQNKLLKKRLTIVTILLIISLVSKITFQSIYASEANVDYLFISRDEDTWIYPVTSAISIATGIILPLSVITYLLMQSLRERKLIAHRYSQRSL